MKKKIPMIYSEVKQTKEEKAERAVKMFLKGKAIDLTGDFEMTVGDFTDMFYSREEVEEAIKKYKLKQMKEK